MVVWETANIIWTSKFVRFLIIDCEVCGRGRGTSPCQDPLKSLDYTCHGGIFQFADICSGLLI